MTRKKLALRGWMQVLRGQIVREIGYALSHERMQRRGILIEKLGHGLLYRAHRLAVPSTVGTDQPAPEGTVTAPVWR
ncbi:hypothetical protein D3W54_09030 [Komagataeibacter medellinensis]|uniref:Transposase n=1 Tax=Komagataeibacter medellinensis TaxID=1177712 RepID=A0ABQ6VVU3_9PROT|nr:hypothetical protein [Komagataeibacter medellinensis]KAB8124311.1 hypothetical protein D3W54_09030 [Komagataeibacter medellinensis]